ncbi:MAG: tetratricopeptide repeat protein [Dysgonamonadaceae bacterium]|jgi:tetratricopeptide (TPR) repeat protein|nr:tetratricopeptide repeat protein [Dysgonamonadaceae bacterium]
MALTHQDIRNCSAKITEALENKRLKLAFDTIGQALSSLSAWQLKERLTELEDNYRMMLRYMSDGVKDPRQEKIYHDLLRAVWQIADLTVVELKAQSAYSVLYDYRKNTGRYFPETPLQLIHEQDEQKLFNVLSSTLLWSADEQRIWADYIANDLYSDSGRCLSITALTLNLEELFDERKINILLEAAENFNEEIRQRALTGVLLALRRYDSRLYLYPAIKNRLEYLAENTQFVRDIRHIIQQFILSRETEKVSQIMKDEIIPGMMKISPVLNEKIRMKDLFNETGIDEKNPEWQTLIEDSGLAGRLQEFSEMQMEGVDVMHSSFLHLKNFPFFSELHNWFLLFNKNHRSLENKEFSGFANILAESSILCNSDKYSFFFSIGMMPEKYREMIAGQFSVENDAIKDMLKEEITEKTKKAHPAARQYIQDLYRFYKLYPRNVNIEDVFAAKPEFYRVPSIAQFIADEDNMRIIGEYYFNRNYFEEAADIFTHLLEGEIKDETLLQKRGYCYQMLGNLRYALNDYQKAELFNENSSWTIKKIAYCYRALKQPEEALAYYRRAEQMTKDSLSLEMSIGHCLLEMQHYDEALKHYFKVEYLAEKKEKAWRPIAWCSFLCRKYEQAKDYFQKIIAFNPNATDYLNIGHVCLAMGNNREALQHYASALALHNGSYEKFLEVFTPDIPDLLAAGVKEADIPVFLDSLMYGENIS